MNFKEQLIDVFNNHGIKVTDKQAEQFEVYFNLITEWNEKFNLTTILNQEDVIYKHFLDSCLICEELKPDSTLIDVGAGAGLPGIPIKILRPDVKIELIDGLNKRVTFLKEVIEKLGLTNITAEHHRCEELAHKPTHREKFDYCVARAVAPTNVLMEYCLPFVKLYGYVVAYKGKNHLDELQLAENAVATLGGKVVNTKLITINKLNVERALVFIQKKFKCPANYPRGNNKPRTNPL